MHILLRRASKPAAARRSRAGSEEPAAQSVHVLVRGGFHPETIAARAGRPLRITFRREEAASWSERVIIPGLGRSVMLSQGEEVTVELMPERPGVYELTCQLGMSRGRLIVSPD